MVMRYDELRKYKKINGIQHICKIEMLPNLHYVFISLICIVYKKGEYPIIINSYPALPLLAIKSH
jgi:hypothetical protein